MNKPEVGKLRRMVALLGVEIVPLLFALPAYAVTDVQVAVTIAEILEVEYTGDPVITFTIGCGDIQHGSKVMRDQGDVNWWSNTAPWKIMIERTEWDTDDGDPDLELWLQVKYGPPVNAPWTTVPVETDPNAPAVWIEGDEAGSGTYVGVDWKVKGLNWGMQPGTYWCTVTISIVAG